jgi:branched-chain amino acid aminotransferase
MSTKTYYVGGEFVEATTATLPITDLAVVRGYGVFDFFRTYGGLPVQLERNVERLRNSAQAIGLTLPWPDDEISALILETIRRNDFKEASCRVIVTGGDAPDFFTPQDKPRLLIYVEPIRQLPEWWYSDGVRVAVVDEERHLPQSKSINYIPAIMAMKAAHKIGAVEALYRDRYGNVREGTTTNVFAYFGGERVVTPITDILPGVTRRRVIEVLSQRYIVEERDLPYDELLTAEEAVITAANKQIVPVVAVDNHTIRNTPGPWNRQLMTSFAEYMQNHARQRDTQTV